ncbi:MAG: NAD(P)H-dependent oxidoreductase [Myxococcales bacterium]|nr:NAD(P)H-dependent oxidoreductase [Myxococcales bacterium]
MSPPTVRRLTEYVPLTKEEYRARFFARFEDPAFTSVSDALELVFEKAWDGYHASRKSPNTRPAGAGFADVQQPLAVEWLETRAAVNEAQRRQRDASAPSRMLLVSGSTRSEHTCPGEVSKTRRLIEHARKTLEALPNHEVDLLDVSALADEPLKVIYPCKACVSTAQPLCHWPCSCYPNHALGQTGDWMNELYPRWAAAHGVFIVSPVNWYHVPASLKLMMDRLVCADGGNADPTTTHGKDPQLAKAVELAGWSFPKHLAGRAFAVVTHGDAAGPENLRRMLVDWLTDLGMVQAGPLAALDTWIGWNQPYATSHDALDEAQPLFEQVAQAALSLSALVTQLRSGTSQAPNAGLRSPIQK